MKNKFLLYTLVSIITYSCSKDDDDLPIGDPKEAILGKWELTHSGNGVDAPPIVGKSTGYEEYLHDGVFRFYNYEEKQFYTDKFWFSDSLLIKSFTYIDVVDGDTIELTEPYKYDFINRNKLILHLQYPAMQTTFIYKRIK